MPHIFHVAPEQNRYYAWFEALHTRIDLLLLGALSESDFQTAEYAIRAELADVEKMGNRFDPDSELSRAVEAATACPVSISKELFSLLSRCLQANRETGGLFDITVNSPDSYPGLINAVELTASPDNSGGSLYIQGVSLPLILDLSGILKGYALERLRTLLSTLGITDALINLGNSSILSLGHNPSDIPSGHCLTTSGSATSDRRHIRNPLTGEFITGQHEVSVTTSDAIDGEILATITFLRS